MSRLSAPPPNGVLAPIAEVIKLGAHGGDGGEVRRRLRFSLPDEQRRTHGGDGP
jgi:hypothetical protein